MINFLPPQTKHTNQNFENKKIPTLVSNNSNSATTSITTTTSTTTSGGGGGGGGLLGVPQQEKQPSRPTTPNFLSVPASPRPRLNTAEIKERILKFCKRATEDYQVSSPLKKNKTQI
jgi:hypothetical protein